MRRRLAVPFAVRIVISCTLLSAIVVELVMLIPEDVKRQGRSRWIQEELSMIEAEDSLSVESRKRVQMLMEKIRSDLEASSWRKLWQVVGGVCVMSVVLNAVIWKKVILPARKIFEEEVVLARMRQKAASTRKPRVAVTWQSTYGQ
jgi:hypothetical protein